MSKSLVAIAVIAVAALVLPAHAGTAPCYTTTTPDFTVQDGSGKAGGDVYVDLDSQSDVNTAGNVWIYQETNGHPGLQREDPVVNDVKKCTDGTIGDEGLY